MQTGRRIWPWQSGCWARARSALPGLVFAGSARAEGVTEPFAERLVAGVAEDGFVVRQPAVGNGNQVLHGMASFWLGTPVPQLGRDYCPPCVRRGFRLNRR